MNESVIPGRLQEALDDVGINQSELARRVGVTPQAVTNWIKGRDKPGRDILPKLGAVLRVNPWWIIGDSEQKEDNSGTFGVSFWPKRGRPVPVMDNAVAVMERIPEQLRPNVVHTYFDCGPSSFVIEITDRSNAPLFQPHDAVAIDPDETPRPGDMVLASMKPDDRPVFRRYQTRTAPDGHKYVELKPLNTDWDTEQIRNPSDGRIIGVMTEHVTPRR